MTILTVDDDVEDQELFTEVISLIDPKIICLKACDGIEAFALLNDGKTYRSLDYIFLDINMPKMNGIELLLLIKKSEQINLLGSSMIQKQSQLALSIKMMKSIIQATPILH